jgi:hypothetical protein
MVLSQRGKHIKIEKSRRTDKRQKRTHYTVIVECRKDIDGFETDTKVTKMDGEKEGQVDKCLLSTQQHKERIL